jgi:hypothetical protein
VEAVVNGQTPGVLPRQRHPLGVSTLLLFPVHGLVDLLVSRHGKPDEGFNDPPTLIRLLLNSMHSR